MRDRLERQGTGRDARQAARSAGDRRASSGPRRQPATRPSVRPVTLQSARPAARVGAAQDPFRDTGRTSSRSSGYTRGQVGTRTGGARGSSGNVRARSARGGAPAARGGAGSALEIAGRALLAVAHGLAVVLRTLWRAVVALLRFLVPLCRRYPKQAIAVVGAVAVAVAIALARGQIQASQLAAHDAATYAGAQQQAQALASAVAQTARDVVEPTSTPRDQWQKGQMPYLYQTDPEWSHESYSNGRLRHQGCGPTALSMVYIELTGKTDMDPAAMCRFATKSGFSTDQDGTSWSIMTDGAAQLGLTGTQLSVSEARLRAELEAGRPVICIMNPGHFTSSGHYIAIEKLDADGKAVVHDSNSSVRSQKTWDLSIIASEAASAWSFTAE